MFRVSAGTLTDPTTPDTEISTDGGATFADCAEEVTTGGSNGAGFITLSGAETNNNLIDLAAKSANCLTTPAILVPRVLAIVGSGTLSAGSAGGGTLGTLLAYDVCGCFIRTTGGTGGGGTGGANNQARKIVTYSTTTGALTVTPNWETTPDATTTYDVLLPEGVTLGMLRTLNPTTAGRTLVVDASGLADANAVKVGPTGAGTVQTAGDLVGLINALADSGLISIFSPILSGNRMEIVKGDAYLAADGRQLYYVSAANVVADLTGAAIRLVFMREGYSNVSCAGSVTTPTGSSQRVSCDVTTAKSVLLTAGTWKAYWIAKMVTSANEVTLAIVATTVLDEPDAGT